VHRHRTSPKPAKKSGTGSRLAHQARVREHERAWPNGTMGISWSDVGDNARLIDELKQACVDLGTETYGKTAVFKTAISWKTDMTSDELIGNKIDECEHSKFAARSINTVDDKEESDPVFEYDTGIVKVRNFEWLAHILANAGDNAASEIQHILQENATPIENMLGKGYDGEKSLVDTYKASLAADTSFDSVNTIVALESFARKLYAQADVLTVSGVPHAEAEVRLLKDFSGIDKDINCLETIDWESAYVSHTGVRAPPWRQSEGDLGYIVVKPFDGDSATVVIHADGCWQIKGNTEEGMNYDKVGSTHVNVVTFLQAHSEHFKSTFPSKAPYAYDIKRVEGFHKKDSNDDGDDAALNASLRATKTSRKATMRLTTNPTWTVTLDGLDTTGGDGKNGKRGRKNQTLGDMAAMYGADEEGDEDMYDDDDDDEDEEVDERRPIANAELPAEYWQIHKLVKFLNSGNQTATIIALCSLRDFDLTKEMSQFAMQDVKGIDTLVNLLDAADSRCKVGALQILCDLSLSPQIKQTIADLDGIQAMVKILDDDDDKLRALAAATMANCAQLSRNRKLIRKFGGIEKLVGLLKGSEDEEDHGFDLERCGALALWSCCKSRSIRRILMATDAMDMVAHLLQHEHEQLLIPLVGIVEECAKEDDIREIIRDLDMIPFIVQRLSSTNEELQAHSASAIFNCGNDEESRRLVMLNDGIKPLVALLAKVGNRDMLVGATGAIWKCALDAECNAVLCQSQAVENLVPLLTDQPEEVLVNVVGALSELAAANTDSRKAIRNCGGLEQLVKLLTGTNEDLLINVTRAVGQCANDKDNMAAIDKQDGVRLLWSLLKSPNPEVQAGAAWAIGPCIELAPRAGEMVRSFVGGLELIVRLLKSEHIEVLASVCAAVAQIAKDEENLAVITDYGVVPMLGRLTPTTDDRLRRHLAAAISECCTWGGNRIAFGDAEAVAPLVKYLRSMDSAVHQSTALALCQLSQNARNCITMHEANVVMPMIAMVGSPDRVLQVAAAQCLSNIRRLAMVNELAKYQ